MSKSAATSRALRALGSASALAEVLGVTPQAVAQWKEVPPLRVLAVERATGVPRHELRPDIYPPPQRRRSSDQQASA